MTKRLAVLLLLLLVGGCRPRADTSWTKGAPVEIDLLRIEGSFEENAYVDVVLRNSGSEPRWFLLPGVLPASPVPTQGGVYALEAFAWTGQGSAIEGDFMGSAGFHAFRVPGRSALRIRELPIMYGSDVRYDGLPADVIVARSFRIDGRPDTKWFAADPTASVNADVWRRVPTSGIQTHSLKPLLVEIDEVDRIRVEIQRRPQK